MDYCGQFESCEERALVHIPLAMRYRLDQSGMKLTLEQWQALPMALRHRALELPCDSDVEIADFQRELAALVKALLDENVTRFKVTRPFTWQHRSAPEELNLALRELHCDSVSDEMWRQLDDFQRYVLLAFARPGRVSSRLPKAFAEFHLNPRSSQSCAAASVEAPIAGASRRVQSSF